MRASMRAFLFVSWFCLGFCTTAGGFAVPAQAAKIQPKKVRCRGAKGWCIQYSEKDHAQLLKRLEAGKSALAKVKKYRQIQEQQKKLDALAKKQQELLQQRFALWNQERGLWRRNEGLWKEQRQVLVGEMGRLEKRNKVLEKQLAGMMWWRQPMMWVSVVGALALGAGVGYIAGGFGR